MIPLLLMVSSVIAEFIIPLMVGVIVGSYSSIFLCSPIFFELNKKDETSKYLLKQQDKERKEKQEKKFKSREDRKSAKNK